MKHPQITHTRGRPPGKAKPLPPGTNKCLKCLHRWKHRNGKLSARCPNCFSGTWQVKKEKLYKTPKEAYHERETFCS